MLYNETVKFFEDFNSSLSRQPHSEKHDIFVVYVKSDDCGIVQDLDYHERCNFIKETDDCKEHVNIIDYLSFVYCTVDARNEYTHWVVMLALLIFVCYMFSILGSSADMFLCPSLTVISTVLRMSENLAGVTILAFGNGAPDIFTSLANMDGETNLLMAEAYGSAVFIIGAISGVIIVIQPFKVYPPAYIRDVTFIICVCVYVSYIVADGTVNLWESCAIILLYVLYIIVVILDQLIVMRMAKDVQRKLDMIAYGVADAQLKAEIAELKEQGVLEAIGKKSHVSLDIDDTKSASFIGDTANTRLLSQFIKSLNPVDKEDWDEAGFIGKAIIIVKAPMIMLMLLVIPIVDYEKEIHGWSKLLNSLQLVITPIAIIVINSMWDTKFFNQSIFVYVGGIGGPLMLIVFSSSRTDRPPAFHVVYAFISMVVCIIIIQTIASEVVTILDTVGIAAKLTPSFLGCTILAWGNSVGDLMSNITFAKQGHHKMGFAACFGGPLIIIILGFGITFIYKSASSPDKVAEIRQGSMGSTCNMFLLFIAVSSMLGICLSKYQARSSMGIYLLAVYMLFLLYTILGEFEVIHTYGTDHQEQRVRMD